MNLVSLKTSIQAKLLALKTKAKALETKLLAFGSAHLGLLIMVAVPLILLYWHDLLINLLVKDSAHIVDSTQKQDAALSAKETKENTQADQLVADAQKTAQESDSQTVDENWNKK